MPLPCNSEEFGFGRPQRDKGDYKPRKSGLVFERIENLVKATKDENLAIAAMSPRRFTKGAINPSLPFDCKPPQIAVFLNLAALKSKEVYYRPELQVLEDMIFGYECEKNGLIVFIDNLKRQVILQNVLWMYNHSSGRLSLLHCHGYLKINSSILFTANVSKGKKSGFIYTD